MMRTLVSTILIFTCAFSKAQVNLVLNPSFEQYSQCPNSADQISLANYWSAIDSFGNAFCTPEYLNACAGWGNGLVGVPFGIGGYQYPRTGNGMADAQVFFDEAYFDTYLRDYLQGRLYTALTDGQSYCVTFYVSRTAMSRYAVDRIGAYFDDGSIDTSSNCGLPKTQYTPQIQNPLGLIVDTVNWVKIEGTFTANGSEKFITIGNFYNKANTNYLVLPSNENSNSNYTWYFIDDVSVIPSDLPAYAGPDVWVALGDSIFIGRPPEIGLECKWYVGGNLVDSGGGIWVHPTVSTTYVVEQTLCGLVKTDTVHVQVVPTSINGITNSKQLSIYPNPATTELTVYMENIVFSQCTIMTSVGQSVATRSLSETETHIDISALPSGVYYLQLNGDKGREVRSFVKM
jgi:hypothetical protein